MSDPNGREIARPVRKRALKRSRLTMAQGVARYGREYVGWRPA
jgi:hypothetical protein